MTDPTPSSLTAAPAPVPASGLPAGRRQWLFGGVALAAAAVGAGYAWYRNSPRPEDAGALQSLWGMSFDTPTGGSLALQAFKGKPLFINFWATWCPPCVEELPLLDNFYRQNAVKSWQVLGLAIDQPSAVRSFLQKTPVSFPIGLAGLGGTELGKSLGNLSGGLPFSIVLDARGAVAQRKMGKISADDLRQWTALS